MVGLGMVRLWDAIWRLLTAFGHVGCSCSGLLLCVVFCGSAFRVQDEDEVVEKTEECDKRKYDVVCRYRELFGSLIVRVSGSWLGCSKSL